jgi:ADP-heptose:LPS heptosyltransferase
LVLHGPGQEDYAKTLARGRMETAECSTMEDWVRRLQEATAVGSINTGPMHMAAALKKPLVVIDGPSRLPLWQPAFHNSRVVHHQDALRCAPCHQISSGEDCGYECMKRIGVDEVFRALLEVLTRASPAPHRDQRSAFSSDCATVRPVDFARLDCSHVQE